MEPHKHGWPAPRPAERTSAPAGFDFTAHIRRLCTDAVSRLPQLVHIDFAHIATAFAQTRKRTSHGLYASLVTSRWVGKARNTWDDPNTCSVSADVVGDHRRSCSVEK